MPAPSFNDFVDLARAEALVKRPELQMREGDISEMFVLASAAMADRFTGYAAERIAALYLASSEGDDLTTLADDRYNVQREPAVAAIGTVTFTSTGGPFTGTIPSGTRIATTPDAAGNFQEFTTDSDLVFAAETTKSVDVTASVAGRDGNVAATAINRILDTIIGWTGGVSNAALTVGGYEEESDADLRDRVKGINSTQRRGTLSALEVGAKEVPAVKQATAVEAPVTLIVTVYVTDADGNSNAAMVTAATAEIENWRCAGATVSVSGGALFAQAIDFSLVVRAGTDIAALALSARTSVVNAVNRLRIGETLYRDLIQTAARNADPDAIQQVTVNVPAADVAPSSNQIIRADLSTTSVT